MLKNEFSRINKKSKAETLPPNLKIYFKLSLYILVMLPEPSYLLVTAANV